MLCSRRKRRTSPPHRKRNLQQTRRNTRRRKRAQHGGQQPTLSVTYAPHLQVAGQQLTMQQTAAAPTLTFSSLDPAKTYVLLLHDPDAPTPSYVHWVLKDITTANQKGTVVLPYQGPHPPPHAPIHRYIFTLFVQPPYFKGPTERIGFDAAALPPSVATQQFTVKSPPTTQ